MEVGEEAVHLLTENYRAKALDTFIRRLWDFFKLENQKVFPKPYTFVWNSKIRVSEHNMPITKNTIYHHSLDNNHSFNQNISNQNISKQQTKNSSKLISIPN